MRQRIAACCADCSFELISSPGPWDSRAGWRGQVRVVTEVGARTVCSLCAIQLVGRCEHGTDVTVMLAELARVDPDDVSRCPLDSRCEFCGGERWLELVTAGSRVGVFCVTLCDGCASAGRLPALTPADAARRVAEHAGHLGCTVDDLSISDPR